MIKLFFGALLLLSLSSHAEVRLPLECSYQSGPSGFKDLVIVFKNTSKQNEVEVISEKINDSKSRESKTYTAKQLDQDAFSVKGKTKYFGLNYAFEYKVTKDQAVLTMMNGRLKVVYKCRPI
ncbi:hypothetical protein GW915_12570 [bacterium]|nr:hypothetical protein [bacterium]